MNAPVKSLSARLREPGLVVAPGVFDMVSLRLADSFGFDALSAGMARTPLIADADTGYGGLLNIRHTMHVYQTFRQQGSSAGADLPLYDFAGLTRLMGLEDVWAFEQRYAETDS